MYLIKLYDQWYGVWCDQCLTPTCKCGNAQHPQTVAVDGDDQLPGMSYSEVLKRWGGVRSFNLNNMAQDFYRTVALKMSGQPHDPDVIPEVAEALARGAAASCLGEARYEMSCVIHEYSRRAKPQYLAGKMYEHSRLWKYARQAGLGTSPHDSGVHRDDFVDNLHLSPAETAHLARRILGAHLRFTGASGGYGGVLWWEGAYLTSQYYRGRISPMVYADLMFNAMHNGGNLLNKVFHIDTLKLMTLLDKKRVLSPNELLVWFSYNTAPKPSIQDAFFGESYRIKGQDLWEAGLDNGVKTTTALGADWKAPDSMMMTGVQLRYTQWVNLVPVRKEDSRWPSIEQAEWDNAYSPPDEWNIAPLNKDVERQMLRLFPKWWGKYEAKPNDQAQLLLKVINPLPFFDDYTPVKSPNKDKKRNQFYEKYRNQHHWIPGEHHCWMCGYEYLHKHWQETLGYGDEECEYDTDGCCHTSCGDCCCGQHMGSEHSEWCDFYTNCTHDYEGCKCLDDYCCHEAYDGGGHNEDCIYYEEEEEDDE